MTNNRHMDCVPAHVVVSVGSHDHETRGRGRLRDGNGDVVWVGQNPQKGKAVWPTSSHRCARWHVISAETQLSAVNYQNIKGSVRSSTSWLRISHHDLPYLPLWSSDVQFSDMMHLGLLLRPASQAQNSQVGIGLPATRTRALGVLLNSRLPTV